MDLTVINHMESPTQRSRKGHRETVWFVTNTGKEARIRTTVHKDPYEFQTWAKLELWSAGEWQILFSADRADTMELKMWETEDNLLTSYGTWAGIEFYPSNSQGALVDSDFIL